MSISGAIIYGVAAFVGIAVLARAARPKRRPVPPPRSGERHGFRREHPWATLGIVLGAVAAVLVFVAGVIAFHYALIIGVWWYACRGGAC